METGEGSRNRHLAKDHKIDGSSRLIEDRMTVLERELNGRLQCALYIILNTALYCFSLSSNISLVSKTKDILYD